MELHPRPQWRMFHILTSEDIDDIISRLSHDSFSKLLLEMASGRFLKITEEDIKYFSDKPENATTKKKTLYDVRSFSEFLASEEETREIEQIVQITGHKNVNSLNNYSVISDKKQQQISDILSGVTEGNENSLATPTQTLAIDEVTATACKIIFA